MSSGALLSSEKMTWQTPGWFLDLVRRVGPIEFDPATAPKNPTGARQFMSIERSAEGWIGQCGLTREWPLSGLVFVNPPYGPHLSGPVEPNYLHFRKDKRTGERVIVGVGRGWARRIADHSGESISLVPVRTETVWWRTLFHASDLVLFWSSDEYGARIQFIDPDTGEVGDQSNLANTVFYKGPRTREFASVFGAHGTLVTGGAHRAVAA